MKTESLTIHTAIFLLTLLVFAGGPVFSQSNNCETTTFQKTYGKPGISDLAHQSNIVETPDHGFITGGWGGDVINQAFFMKTDSRGNIVWSRQFNPAGTRASSIYNFLRLKNGHYLGMGGIYDSPAIWLIEFDENGTIIWQKQWAYPGVLAAVCRNVCEIAGSGFILIGTYSIPNAGGSFIAKFDAGGNLLWNRTSTDMSNAMGIIELNGFLYVPGYSLLGASISKYKSQDGSFVQSYVVTVDAQRTFLWGIEAKNNKLYVYGDNRIVATDDERPFVLIMDESLSVLKSHKFYFDFHDIMDNRMPLAITADGGYIMAVSREGYADILLIRVSYDGTIKWKRQYPRPGAQVTFSIIQTSDNGIVGFGNTNADESWFYTTGNDFLLYKTDSVGIMGYCPVVEPALSVTHPIVELTPAVFTNNPVALTAQPFADAANAINIPVTTLCEKVAACSTIELFGEERVCNLSDEVEYKANRNAGCDAVVTWKTDAAFTQLISSTDSTVRVRFIKPGATKIFASFGNLCTAVSDSISVQALGAPQSLTLGPDILLCENNSYLFTAGPGFTSYSWQDGSTDNEFIATTPGNYHLTATTCDGTVFTDTVIVTTAPLPKGYLKTDTAICEGQPTIITASDDFKSYLWSSGEATKQISITSPARYWLQVTDKNDCINKEYIDVIAKQAV